MAETADRASGEPDGTANTGWRVIADNPSMVAIIDTLLSLPDRREFNKSELAEFADVSRRSVQTHTSTLLRLGVVEEVPNTSPPRYRFDPGSEVSEALVRLDGAVNRNGPHAE
jgi:DNA-binding transcriptional ArsR family regulator